MEASKGSLSCQIYQPLLEHVPSSRRLRRKWLLFQVASQESEGDVFKQDETNIFVRSGLHSQRQAYQHSINSRFCIKKHFILGLIICDPWGLEKGLDVGVAKLTC